MQQIKPITNRTIIIIVLVSLVSILIYTQITKKLVPPTPKEVLNPINTEDITSFKNPPKQTTSFNSQKIPQTITTPHQNKALLTQDEAIALLKKNGYENPTIIPNAVYVEDLEKQITIMANTKTNTIIVDQPYVVSKNTTDEKLIEIAKNKLIPFFSLNSNKLWEESRYFVEKKPDENNHKGAVIVHFFPIFNGYRIITSSRAPVGDVGPAKATFHLEDSRLTLNIELINIDVNNTTTLKLASREEIETKIAEGGSITTAIYPSISKVGKYYEAPLVPSNANFNQFEIVYYYEFGEEGYLKPMILASGETVILSNEKAGIKTLLPAIYE